MTTQEFITTKFGNPPKNIERMYDHVQWCSNVFVDDKGDIYSYGRHYPLLFKVKGLAIRNISGFSHATDRHIRWSRGVNALDVFCGGGFRLSRQTDEEVLDYLITNQNKYIFGLTYSLSKARSPFIKTDYERRLAIAKNSLEQLDDLRRGLGLRAQEKPLEYYINRS